MTFRTTLAALFLLMFLWNCGSKKPTETDNPENDTIVQVSDELKTLNDKITNDPKNADLFDQRAKYYASNKQFNEALQDINKALELSDNSSSYMISLADIYFKMGSPSKTREILQQILEKEPENIEAILKFAELHFFLRDYKVTNNYVNKALKISNNNPQALVLKGFVLKETGDTTNAINTFLLATQYDPDNFAAYEQLGVLHAQKKNPLAIEFYKHAIRIQPNNPAIYYNLAMYFQEDEKYQEAIQIYTDITKIDPEFKYAYYNLGYIHHQFLDLHKVAIDYFTKAINVAPDYYQAIAARGLCYESLGDITNAEREFKIALDIKNNYNVAIDGLNRIKTK